MTTPVQDPGAFRGPTPVSTTALQAYTQPGPVAGSPLSLLDLDVDEAIVRQRAILDSGAYTRPPLLHPLGNGRALLITEVLSAGHPPTADPAEDPDPPGWLSRWRPYLLAGGVFLGVTTGGAVLLVWALGLVALVSWGAENALTVGAVSAALFVGGLGFLLVSPAPGPLPRGGGTDEPALRPPPRAGPRRWTR
ncbi:MAG: hypothetical protein M3460_04625 [Actinomycetota bacterium]|nr:hypothetical protein [Actinomycetota bacterium]